MKQSSLPSLYSLRRVSVFFGLVILQRKLFNPIIALTRKAMEVRGWTSTQVGLVVAASFRT